ncbi:hypothetical protein [Streptomyces sp. NPDC020996]|uniref:hypothetical protein n=1 Tax=Streptomyces sp. NPDC020996 TaxID=3154791 RepID=UPI0033F997C2
MLALRLTRGAHPAVQLRRLLVAVASAGTGFLLLCTLGHALGHPDTPGTSLLRLAWCLTPLAATVHFAVAAARTDPGTRPRPGLSAIGLGPARLMAVSATTTALSTALGSMLALLVFLHLRGDLTGLPFDGAAARSLAADRPLPLPATLTLLALVPGIASVAVAVVLRPRDLRPAAARGAARASGRSGARTGRGRPAALGAYDWFGARASGTKAGGRPARAAAGRRTAPTAPAPEPDAGLEAGLDAGPDTRLDADLDADLDTRLDADLDAELRAELHTAAGPAADGAPQGPGGAAGSPAPGIHAVVPAPKQPPTGLPWGIAVLAAGLAVEAYASRTESTAASLTGAVTGSAPAVLAGWALTALGLALAAPALTHLTGLLVQAVRPGALRLLAGRVLMAEATRIGRPLGIVCAVVSGSYAMTALYGGTGPLAFGPLTTLGTLLVAGCACATLLTAAAEARHARAEITAALLRLGAPATLLRGAAALRTGALLALFGPLTLVVAELAALPLAR